MFTPPDQTSLEEIKEKIDYLESIQAPVQSVNGQTGEVELTAEDVGAISQDDLVRLENLLIQIQDKINQGTVVDNITVNEINNMVVKYFENKTVSEVEE